MNWNIACAVEQSSCEYHILMLSLERPSQIHGCLLRFKHESCDRQPLIAVETLLTKSGGPRQAQVLLHSSPLISLGQEGTCLSEFKRASKDRGEYFGKSAEKPLTTMTNESPFCCTSKEGQRRKPKSRLDMVKALCKDHCGGRISATDSPLGSSHMTLEYSQNLLMQMRLYWSQCFLPQYVILQILMGSIRDSHC